MGAFQTMEGSRATGLAAYAGGGLGSFFTPLFWALAFSFFVLFLAGTRFSSRPLRTVLFWIPVRAISMLGLAIFGFVAYAMLDLRSRWILPVR